MSSRESILSRLRAILARDDLRFPPLDPEPLTAETRMAVTAARGGGPELAHRFQAELTALHGTADLVGSPAEARLTLINRLVAWQKAEEESAKGVRLQTGQEKLVLAWEPDALPLDHLAESLADMGLNLFTPASLTDKQSREEARHIRYGLTGVEAAFASTGSMLVATGPGAFRSASLLPLRHIALIPLTRLYSTLEAWLAERRDDNLDRYVRSHPNLTLITGPSKSGDIEMNLTLGVHGPKFVHAILFDDTVHDDESFDSFWRYVPRPEKQAGDERPTAKDQIP